MNHLSINPLPLLSKVGNAVYPKNELTGRRSVHFIPNFLINSIGHFSYSLDCPFKEQVKFGEEHDLVQKVFNKLVAVAEAKCPSSKNNRWEIRIKETPQLNACCFPGGKIIITTAMLRKLKEEKTNEVSQEDLVAAVLGHEVSHALAEHGRLNVQLSLIVNMVLKLVARILPNLTFINKNKETENQTEERRESIETKQDESKKDYKFLKTLLGWASVYFLAQNSQSCEFEADKFGIEFAHRANYNPKGAIKLQEIFLKMENEKSLFKRMLDGPSFLSSHPPSDQRLEENRKTVEKLLPSKIS